MNEPSQNEIDKLKSQFSDRALAQVEATSDGDSYAFIVTGPNKPEYDKFLHDIQAASALKSDEDKSRALRLAVEKAALAQIRWPDRAEVVALFEKYPAMSLSFAEELHKLAGASFEVRSKKL